MKLRIFIILALIVQLLGCAPQPKPFKMYSGNTISIEKLARIRVPNVKVFVKGVNDKKLWSFSGGLLDKSEVHVLPGIHKLWVSHTTNETGTTGLKADTEIELNAEMGHVYTVLYQHVGDNKVAFYIRDHGANYDEKCAALLNKPNMLIYIGHEVPQECY